MRSWKLRFVERLPDYKWQQRHKAGALYRLRKRALVGRRKSSAAARHNLAVRVDKLLKRLDIFVVEGLYLRSQQLCVGLLHILEGYVVGVNVLLRVVYGVLFWGLLPLDFALGKRRFPGGLP